MKQVVLNTYGASDVLEVADVEKPAPGPGEVLIEIEAAGINYSDILRRRNTYFMPTPLPYVLGVEAVGTIVELGATEGTSPVSKGDRVLAILPYGGGYAEYVCAHAEYCIPLPPPIDSTVATALFVQGSTAQLMIDQLMPELEGKTVLVHAAAGGVGSFLVQLIKNKGARVIATASSEEKLSYAQSIGADEGVNYSEEGWAEAVIKANGGEKVDVVFEMVGGDVFRESFNCIKPGGTVIVYGAASGQKGMIHSEHYVDETLSLHGFNLAFYMQHHFEAWQNAMGTLIQDVASGAITVRAQDVFSLDQVQAAHQAIEDRRTKGKVVLTI